MSINIKKKALNVKNGDTYDNFDMFFLGDVGEAVDKWFEEHPEAVTNVADNSITAAKLAPSVRESVEEVTDLKSAITQINNIDEIYVHHTFNAQDQLVNTSNNDRACQVEVELLPGYIHCDSSFLFALDVCGDDMQRFITVDGETWLSNGVLLPTGAKYNILVKKVDGTNFSDSDVTTFVKEFYQYKSFYTKAEVNKLLPQSKLYGKTITAIGDSFIDVNTAGLGNDLISKIAEGKNMTIHNYGLPNSSMAEDPNDTVPSVIDRYQTMLSQVHATDYLIVLAGHNDSNPSLHGGTAIPIGTDTDTVTTTFKGALNTLIPAFLTAYPTAGILFLTPFQRRGTEGPYVDAMKEMCAKYSIPCFDNYRESGIWFYNSAQDAEYDVGNLHLNAKGNERMARRYIPILESL